MTLSTAVLCDWRIEMIHLGAIRGSGGATKKNGDLLSIAAESAFDMHAPLDLSQKCSAVHVNE